MDTKNVIAAISLSAAVIILYGLFFAPSPQELNQIQEEKNQIIQSSETPSLEVDEKITEISRNDALTENQRVVFENESIKGSISLKGSTIDDLIFKKYTETLNGTDHIILLNPREAQNGYFVETGWATNSKNVDVPNAQTVWQIEGNNKLTPNRPVNLTWENDLGIKFQKKISLDNQYLFTIDQSITNSTNNKYDFYSYGQIIRKTAPEVTNFYILHEGFQAVLDDELIEEDYDDIQEKKFSRNASQGWLGIGDKYWITSIIPPENKGFKTTFDYKKKFRANYISTEGIEAGPNDTIEEEIRKIVAAKRVKTIDGYAESLNINKFDLVIDFGVLYFLTKPMWFALDYFFKLLGNYGLAIIAVTVCIRLAVFPLANYSFRSMAKMKKLTPETKRLKDTIKDKTELQKAMMQLYKREKVNPMSGCLPIIPQIFIFFSLYKVLFVTIEMRHMPFFGWIQDLSERDPTSVFNLFGLIPWDPPSFLLIGAWPCLMGISMYLQQKLNPTPPDPVQAKIFMFFPLFLTVILAPFPSGLVIYWTINNILTMAQQIVIMKRTTVKTV